MTNIYDFPSRKAETKEDGFLQQGSDTLAFDESGKNVDFSDRIFQSLEQSRNHESQDWTNQELANIFRVKSLLDAAEVPCAIERGQSDEGDPWCVYCTPGGEVFIHLCRIAGTYILDSPNLTAPISGANFTQLIENFSNGALQKSRAGNTQKYRLVRLNRGDNLFLHPATLLAALIWSIYVESEDLVLLSQDDQDEPSRDDAILQVNDLAKNPSAHALLNEAAFIDGHTSDTDLMNVRLPDHLDVEQSTLVGAADYAPQRDVTGKNGLFPPQTMIATGLSAVAVAVGLLSESFVERQPYPELIDLLATLTDDHHDNDTLLANAESPDNTNKLDLATVLTSFFDHLIPEVDAHDSALAKEIAADIAPATPGSIQLAAAVESLLTDLAENIKADIAPAHNPNETVNIEFADLLGEQPTTNAFGAGQPASVPEVLNTPVLLGLIDTALKMTGLQASFEDRVQKYALGNTVVEASFDIASIEEAEASALAPLLPGKKKDDVKLAEPVRQDDTEVAVASPPPAPPQTDPADEDIYSFAPFEDNERKFVDYLMAKSEKIEMIATDNELIIVDFAAFDEITDRSHTMSWSLSDGDTISVIGLTNEFQEFGLIA